METRGAIFPLSLYYFASRAMNEGKEELLVVYSNYMQKNKYFFRKTVDTSIVEAPVSGHPREAEKVQGCENTGFV